jgi:hypothetical protein
MIREKQIIIIKINTKINIKIKLKKIKKKSKQSFVIVKVEKF